MVIHLRPGDNSNVFCVFSLEK